ncbi:MAG: hypothetical protein IT537_06915 [Hyphomicrobiales bacterium]|nr:hypothetical protein [Hyphomicrobiales bacterium]
MTDLRVCRGESQSVTSECGGGPPVGPRGGAWARVLCAMTAAALLAACSTNMSLTNVTLPTPESVLRKPDWASYSGGKNDFELRPITGADLVGPDGICAEPARGFADQAVAQNAPTGGISLQMTECEVVKRAGAVDKADFGVNERGERAVVLTILRGPWPGVYSFAGGRLVSIEKAPSPPSAAPAKSPKGASKKPAGT